MASTGVVEGSVMDQDWDETVYRRVSPRLMGLAASLVGPTDAHDVVAGALERVMSSTSRSDVRNIEAYLVRAVVNEARRGRVRPVVGVLVRRDGRRR